MIDIDLTYRIINGLRLEIWIDKDILVWLYVWNKRYILLEEQIIYKRSNRYKCIICYDEDIM